MPRKRKLPDGLWERNGVYYARFRAGGRLIRKRLSTNLDAAKELLNEMKARADRADFGLLDNDFSLTELRDEWLRHCDQTLRPSTVKRYRENLANILEGESAVPATRVSQITAAVIVVYRQDRLAKDASPRTINMEVGALSTMFNYGAEHRFIGSNPLAKIKPLPNDTKRKNRRALTVEEATAIFEHSSAYLRPVWRMFCSTGIRREELVELRFSDIDFAGRCIVIRAGMAKSRKTREIPLDDELMAMLTDLRDRAKDREPVEGVTPWHTERQLRNFSRDHVFVTTANTPLKNNLLEKFYAVCRRAGIDGAEPGGGVDIHSLRGTFATLTIDGGASPKAVQAILGHSTLAMTMNIYAKATESAKRDAIASLPFGATVSRPRHVLAIPKPVQNAHAARTNKKISPKTDTA
ncbi:MAG: site-specific integrase [Planctomycetes bacterium]|nr:site-specific integrase [Planctomycetota bacterium]